MNKKKNGISSCNAVIILCTICLVLGISGCGEKGSSDQDGGVAPPDAGDTALVTEEIEDTDGSLAVVSEEPKRNTLVYTADAIKLTEELERIHPVFYMETVPETYEQAKARYLALAEEGLTYKEFYYETQKMLSVMDDLHTKIWSDANYKYIVADWYAVGDSLYFKDENGYVSDRRVVSLGGIPIADIFAVIDDYYPTENEFCTIYNKIVYARHLDILEMAGYQESGDKVEAMVEENGKVTPVFLGITHNKGALSYVYNDYTIKGSVMDGDIFYMDFKTCMENTDFNETLLQMEEAVNQGIDKVIIDARKNSGGNSRTLNRILSVLGMSPPQYGVFISPDFMTGDTEGGIAYERGGYYFEQDKGAAVSNENITLVVLMDELTFSSGLMLNVYVQDGGLGTVIGRPGINAPSCYGDTVNVTLPDSGIQFTVSKKRFNRPDAAADQQLFAPDKMTDVGEDALEVALAMLREES